jgi:hypothetical protein
MTTAETTGFMDLKTLKEFKKNTGIDVSDSISNIN